MNLVLSLVVLAAIALIIGAWYLRRRGAPTRQVGLMLILAAVMIANVLIWTLPDSSGTAPVENVN